MTKSLLICLIAAAPLLAQLPPQSNSLMQDSWLRFDPTSTKQLPSSIDGQSGPVQGKPLSARELRHSEQMLSDGSHINHFETENFYRDTMGRMRTETSTGAIIFDPVGGFTYDLTTARKTYVKRPVSPAATVTIAAADHRSSIRTSTGNGGEAKYGSTTVEEGLPPQTLDGVYVKGVRITITIPAGAIGNDRNLKVVNERWFSDDLELLVKSSNSDPRFGATTYELTNISQTAPDPALFQIPAGYTEGH